MTAGAIGLSALPAKELRETIAKKRVGDQFRGHLKQRRTCGCFGEIPVTRI